jgi:hypothetical protein
MNYNKGVLSLLEKLLLYVLVLYQQEMLSFFIQSHLVENFVTVCYWSMLKGLSHQF